MKAGDIIRMNTIGKNLSIIYRQFTVFLNRELADSELTATELMYIGSLYDQDGVTQDDLAREFCIDKAATARTIQTLEGKGLLLRKVDENDRRAKRIYLTPKVEKYKTTIETVQKKWMDLCGADISKEEIAAFEKMLSKFAERVRR
jgi:DNA-binding MarR family transcriptional regulator